MRRLPDGGQLVRCGGSCIIALAAASALAAQRPVAPPSTVALGRLDSMFTKVTRPDGPGCAVGVFRGGRVVVAKGYGLANVETRRPITAQTAFNLGSASKPFTALAALMLVRDGKLSLDDDIRRWVPEMPDYGTPIRVRDLVQHTTGLRDYGALNALSSRAITSMPEFIGRMAAQRSLNFTPGTRHEYSHSDFTVLGLVIERVVGMPFGEYLERTILAPMGMRHSFVHDERPRSHANRAFGHVVSSAGTAVRYPMATDIGGTNLHASIVDLARWNRNFDDALVGGRAVIDRMLSRPTLASGDTIPYAYGLRLGRYRGQRIISRAGHDNGMLSEFIRFPDQQFTATVLCNADHLDAYGLARRVADIYLGSVLEPAAARPALPAQVAATPAEVARYAGLYRSADIPWLVTPFEVRDGALHEVLFHETRSDTAIPMRTVGTGRFVEIGITGNVGLFTFTPTNDGGMRLAISWNGEPAGEGERIPDARVWRPTTQALAEYEGTFFSEELGESWRIVRRDEQLVLRRVGFPDLALWPVERDMFVRGFGDWVNSLMSQMLFERSAGGQVTRLVVSTPPGEDSAVGITFTKAR